MKTASRILVLVALAASVGCSGSGGKPGEATGEQVQPGSDQERLQGMWEVVAFETARPHEGPGPDKIKAIRLTFAGDKLTIGVGVDFRTNFTFTLDPGKDPKRMTVIETDAAGRAPVTTARTGTTQRVGTAPANKGPVDPLAKSEWIYKFEGEQLVLAVSDPGQPPPTEFKTRTFTPATTAKDAPPASPPGGRVDIVRLQKTTVAVSSNLRFGTAYTTSRITSRSGTAFSTVRSGTFRSTAPATAKK